MRHSRLDIHPFMHNKENGQTYFKNLAMFATQDFESMFGHFATFMGERVNEFVTAVA